MDRKKIDSEHKRKYISSVVMFDIDRERKLKEKYTQMALDKENPNKEKTERDVRMALEESKKRIAADIFDSIRNMRNQIIELIKQELNMDKPLHRPRGIRENLTFEEIESVIEKCLPALEKLNSLSKDDQLLLRQWNKAFTEYERLFNDLIDYDVRFAYFAPKKSIERNVVDLKLEHSNDETVIKVNERIEKLRMDDSCDYLYENIDKTVLTDNEDVNKIIDEENEALFKAKFDLIKSTEFFSDELFEFIVKELKVEVFNDPNLKYKNIKLVLDNCNIALKTLESLSLDEKLNDIAGWDQFNPYTELFNRLIDISIKFAVFAPKSSLSRLNVDYKAMTEEERKVMLVVLKRNGLWDDPEFVEVYEPLFNFSEGLNI